MIDCNRCDGKMENHKTTTTTYVDGVKGYEHVLSNINLCTKCGHMYSLRPNYCTNTLRVVSK